MITETRVLPKRAWKDEEYSLKLRFTCPPTEQFAQRVLKDFLNNNNFANSEFLYKSTRDSLKRVALMRLFTSYSYSGLHTANILMFDTGILCFLKRPDPTLLRKMIGSQEFIFAYESEDSGYPKLHRGSVRKFHSDYFTLEGVGFIKNFKFERMIGAQSSFPIMKDDSFASSYQLVVTKKRYSKTLEASLILL